MNKIIHGDALEKLSELPDNSVDSIVTDLTFISRGCNILV